MGTNEEMIGDWHCYCISKEQNGDRQRNQLKTQTVGIYNIRISIYSVTNSYSYANHFIEQYLQHFHSPNTFHLRLLPIMSSIQSILQK